MTRALNLLASAVVIVLVMFAAILLISAIVQIVRMRAEVIREAGVRLQPHAGALAAKPLPQIPGSVLTPPSAWRCSGALRWR
jgi:hypothetical protein